MQQRRIGNVAVSAIGLGAMPMSSEYTHDRPRAIATIHAALDAGVTLIDTADAYCTNASDIGHNEELVAEALTTYGSNATNVLVATKGGHTRDVAGGWGLNGDPAYLKGACANSLQRLGVESIGLYQFHRPDPRIPFADSIGALRELLDEGKIQLAGISNANPTQIQQAQEILGGRLAAVQNQFSPVFRSSEPELQLCHELGVAFLPWSPLGGMRQASELGSAHHAFAEVALRYEVSPQQVCLAWMLAKSPVVIPIPGASRPETIRDSAAATHIQLTATDLAELDGQ